MTKETYRPTDRRPIASRDAKPIQALAAMLARSSITANQISVFGMCAAIGASACLYATGLVDGGSATLLWIGAAIGVQLRLLANVLDGMVAIAQAKASPIGELYNEVPDRVSDVVILVGFGYAVGGDVMLGYWAALAAVTTAYIRAMGKAAGAGNDFCGPLAKPQRMFLVTVGALASAVAPVGWQMFSIGDRMFGIPAAVLLVITIGGFATALRRLIRIARRLRDAA